MNTIPVNTSAMDFTFLALVPKTDLNGLQTRNGEGVPKWEAQVLCSTEQARRPEVVAVTLTASNPPELQAMTPCQFDQLVARHWENNGRSGIAFSADNVRPAGKNTRPPAPSSNGSKPEPAGATA